MSKPNGYRKDGTPVNSLGEMFNLWDEGEFIYDEFAAEMLKTPEGENVGFILKNVTKCPVHNGTCNSYHRLMVHGYNPDKGCKEHEIWLCPSGHRNIDECSLSK
jgi:glutamine synthetase